MNNFIVVGMRLPYAPTRVSVRFVQSQLGLVCLRKS